MFTDLMRDALFTSAWFGLMAVVWLGWAQEDPPSRWRPWLGAGSVLGLALAGGFGYLVSRHWSEPTALEGRYAWFGVLTAVELIAAGVGCWLLYRRGQQRWFAWWVALVVAVHFAPLGLLLDDASLIVVAVGLSVILLGLLPRLRRITGTTSALVGATMGVVLLLLSVAAGLLALA